MSVSFLSLTSMGRRGRCPVPMKKAGLSWSIEQKDEARYRSVPMKTADESAFGATMVIRKWCSVPTV